MIISIMALSPIQAVEAFHLAFLRILESRLDRSSYVVKGGVNLRAWFGSLRYSEDMDIDAIAGESHQLTDIVDRLLTSPAFTTLLRALQLGLTKVSKPKQISTTQRWKFEIQPEGVAVPLHTKLEISRRATQEPYGLDPVLPEIVRPYGLPAPTANHYTAAAGIRQKIVALADRRETQARDIWDLDHLFRTTRADPRPLPPRVQNALTVAADRVVELPFKVYMGQVVPFLEPDHQAVYGTPESWERMRELVVDRLLELQT
jgi:hypothetical protein